MIVSSRTQWVPNLRKCDVATIYYHSKVLFYHEASGDCPRTWSSITPNYISQSHTKSSQDHTKVRQGDTKASQAFVFRCNVRSNLTTSWANLHDRFAKFNQVLTLHFIPSENSYFFPFIIYIIGSKQLNSFLFHIQILFKFVALLFTMLLENIKFLFINNLLVASTVFYLTLKNAK